MLEVQKLWMNKYAIDILLDMEQEDNEGFEKLKKQLVTRDFIYDVLNHSIVARYNKYCGWICVITKDNFNDYWFWYVQHGVQYWMKKLDGPAYFVAGNLVCYNRQNHTIDVLSIDDIEPEKYLTDKEYTDATNRNFLLSYPVPKDVSVDEFYVGRLTGNSGEIELFVFLKSYLCTKVFRLPITKDGESFDVNEKLEMIFEEEIPDFAEAITLTSSYVPTNIIYIFKDSHKMIGGRVYRVLPSLK